MENGNTDLENSNLTSIQVKKCKLKPNTSHKKSFYNKDKNADFQDDGIDSIHSMSPSQFSEEARANGAANQVKKNTTNMAVDINVQLSTNVMVTQDQFNNIFHQQNSIGHSQIKLR